MMAKSAQPKPSKKLSPEDMSLVKRGDAVIRQIMKLVQEGGQTPGSGGARVCAQEGGLRAPEGELRAMDQDRAKQRHDDDDEETEAPRL